MTDASPGIHVFHNKADPTMEHVTIFLASGAELYMYMFPNEIAELIKVWADWMTGGTDTLTGHRYQTRMGYWVIVSNIQAIQTHPTAVQDGIEAIK